MDPRRTLLIVIIQPKIFCEYLPCSQWKNPGRQDKPFTPFVLRVLSVYGHCKVSIGMLFINSSSVVSSLHLDFPSVCPCFPALVLFSNTGSSTLVRRSWGVLNIWSCQGMSCSSDPFSRLHPGTIMASIGPISWLYTRRHGSWLASADLVWGDVRAHICIVSCLYHRSYECRMGS